MCKKTLTVKMFGTFTIDVEGVQMADSDNHSQKIWGLLSYIVYNRDRKVSQNELIEVLWHDYVSKTNPAGALKNLLYRLRAALDQLWPGAGMQLIITSGNSYYWNTEYPVLLDCDEFERLNELPEDITSDSLDEVIRLLRLYKGPFLQKFASEFWVMPLASYYQRIYIQSLLKALPLLQKEKFYNEIVEFTCFATMFEPFHEDLHYYLISAYVALGQKDSAIDVHQKFCSRLMSELGVLPSEKFQAAYYEATKKSFQMLTTPMLMDQLREKDSLPGALVCDFDFFRILYHSMARSVLRNGIAVHMILVSIYKKGSELSEKMREKEMENLKEILHCTLRRGDSAAQCSALQYVVMLPKANYENSCMVCDRIYNAYRRKYFKSNLELRFEVFPLQPDELEYF